MRPAHPAHAQLLLTARDPAPAPAQASARSRPPVLAAHPGWPLPLPADAPAEDTLCILRGRSPTLPQTLATLLTLTLLADTPAEDILCILYDAFEFIDGALAAGGRVLVHCSQVRGQTWVMQYQAMHLVRCTIDTQHLNTM